MCSRNDDPTQYDRPVTCQQWLWREGMDVLCQRSGAREWRDRYGVEHAACPSHIDAMKRRYPEDLPESADPITAAKGRAMSGSFR